MNSKTTKIAKPEKAAKTSTPVKAVKVNGVISKTEKAKSTVKPAKTNGAVKKAVKKPSLAVPGLSPDDTTKKPDFEQLKQRAYFKYLEEGCPDDRAMQHWLDAEAQMAGE